MGDPNRYVDYTPRPYLRTNFFLVVIIGFTQLLSLLFARIRQPRVIAEVIGGVILGPTVMGRIPNFTNTIFPANSIHLLTLTGTLGLVFFLFIVGVEVDVGIARRSARASLAVSIAGLAIPLGMGAAIAVPIYHNLVEPSVNYGYFILFVAVAVGITAFPVLCRILLETKLLDTTVGVLVLSAGIGNDVTGWVLLALTVALVNASTGLTALYVLLTGIAYVIFILFPVNWAFRWVARRTGCLERGEPTPFVMGIILVLVLISAFFTDVIGIHPIFGQ
jgi:Kef-type K+ transport system membrane component KefB